MKTTGQAAALAIGVFIAGNVAGMPTATAAEGCSERITAAGRAANPNNYDPPKHYNAEKLAKDRAIEKWRSTVGFKCPNVSNLWWRAAGRKVDCEGYAGGIECEASGVPARRIGR